MDSISVPLIALYFLVIYLNSQVVAAKTIDDKCRNISVSGRIFSLSVTRKLDQHGGGWIRSYSVENSDAENLSDDIELEATHSNVECQGKHTFRMEVVIREIKGNQSLTTLNTKKDFLIFHKRHGINVIVMDDGRTAQKIDAEDGKNAVLFTNRPLMNDELFEIRLERRIKKTNNALGIGVVNFSPDDVEILREMHVRNETWIMKHNAIYQNNKAIKSNYGKNLDSLQVNERVGVMRHASGELHIYVNSVDQGIAGMVPENVYGVLELWHDANRAKIVY